MTPKSLDDAKAFAYLSREFSYDPATGSLTRNFARWGKPAGSIATINKANISVNVGGFNISARNVCWCLHTGAWPRSRVFVKNGDVLDMRRSNLTLDFREAKIAQAQDQKIES